MLAISYSIRIAMERYLVRYIKLVSSYEPNNLRKHVFYR